MFIGRAPWPSCRAEPFLIATKPLRPNAFLALVTAAIQALFLPNADFFLLTILPFLFLVKEAAVIPPTVFSLDPRKTNTLAMRPFAILLIAFMAFMAAMAFIAFIALAIVKEESLVFEGVRS